MQVFSEEVIIKSAGMSQLGADEKVDKIHGWPFRVLRFCWRIALSLFSSFYGIVV